MTNSWCRILLLIVGATAGPVVERDLESEQMYPDEHYCELDEKHFMCKMKGFDSLHRGCTGFRMFPRAEVRRNLSAFFNSLRSTYALGKLPGDSFPMTIPDMNFLAWDNELADLAERWVQQCPSGKAKHSDIVRYKVARMIAYSADEPPKAPLEVLNDLANDSYTFHLKGPPDSSDQLYTATSQYAEDKPMTILTNPHLKYFGCAVAEMKLNLKPSGRARGVPRSKANVNSPDSKMPHQRRTVVYCNFGPENVPYAEFQEVGLPCSGCPKNITCSLDSPLRGLCMIRAPTFRAAGHLVKNSVALANASRNADECPIFCSNGALHTRCKYEEAGHNYDDIIAVTGPTTVKYILVWHNVLRDGIAAGTDLRLKHLPLAANMRQLVWNKLLAKSARLWALQCLDVTDECRDERFVEQSVAEGELTYVNQLVTVRPWDIEKQGFPSFVEDILHVWDRGSKYITRQDVQFFNSQSRNKTIHKYFAQLIWARTYMVGCAMALCRDYPDSPEGRTTEQQNVTTITMNTIFRKSEAVGGKTVTTERIVNREEILKIGEEGGYMDYLDDAATPEGDQLTSSFVVAVCNYAPGGALEGNPIYLSGGPCTRCEKIDQGYAGTRGLPCSRDYTHLCSGAEYPLGLHRLVVALLLNLTLFL